MQLGARWRVGDPPHRTVPPELHEAIAATETNAGDAAAGGSWTVTWLEGRPRCELALSTGGTPLLVTFNSLVSDSLEEEEDDDDWLA